MSENVYPKANEGGETAHVAPNPSFPDMEETVLDYWDKDDTFQKSVERKPLPATTARTNSCSSMARLLRTVCRTTAPADRLRQGRDPRATRP